jgi:predicted metal-dependent hydrolase
MSRAKDNSTQYLDKTILPKNLNWPPPYNIRISARSKRLSLHISAHTGLEIVIPKNYNSSKAVEFLNSKRHWVEKNWHLLQYKKTGFTLPAQIYLAALEQTWTVSYSVSNISKISTKNSGQHLVVKGDIQNVHSCLKMIKKWLKTIAKEYLTQKLRDYSDKYQLPFHDITIRDQKSRWGSCSKAKNISLNYKLLYLPENLVHYVLVHELCHTIHFNHSKKFWRLVASLVPDYEIIKAELTKVHNLLPMWSYSN